MDEYFNQFLIKTVVIQTISINGCRFKFLKTSTNHLSFLVQCSELHCEREARGSIPNGAQV